MYKETLILLCIVTAVWTQTCSPTPPGVATSGAVQYTVNAHWAGTILTSLGSFDRNCRSLVSGALSIRSISSLYECRLFATSDCSVPLPQSTFFADVNGWSNTGTRVMGITCPWRCSN